MSRFVDVLLSCCCGFTILYLPLCCLSHSWLWTTLSRHLCTTNCPFYTLSTAIHILQHSSLQIPTLSLPFPRTHSAWFGCPGLTAKRLSVGLAQMFEKVLEIRIIYARNDAGTDGDRHIAILLLKGREDFANLCNDLLHSGIRLLEREKETFRIDLDEKF